MNGPPPHRACRQIAWCFTSILVAWALTSSAAAADDLRLERFRGKVVLVDFWASWCAPCRQSFPWLNAMQAKYGASGLVVVGVNVDRSRADAERFLHDVPASFEIIYDPAGALATRFDVPGMPTSYVLDPTGRMISRHVGFRAATRKEREAELRNALGQSAPGASP